MSDSDSKRTQILLVEDSLTDAILIRALLEQDESIRVTLAQDGIRGCQMVEHQKWDLVITDINLPGKDGFQVIHRCKAHQPDTPIVATSAYSSPSYQEGAYRSGANEVMKKPLDGPEFVRTIMDLLTAKALSVGRPRKILAIGALPGDVEAGCGGILLKHAAAGDEVTILILTAGAGGKEGDDRRAASKRASQVLRAQLIPPSLMAPDLPDLDFMVVSIQDAIHDLRPEIVFTPSVNDVRESRQHTFQATDIAGSKVPGFYCYQAATTTLDFHPTVFEDISDFLDQKMAALSHFEAQVRGRPHLDPELARASARYWGRFLGYGEVEPLEAFRHGL